MVILYQKDFYPEGKEFGDEHAKNLLNMPNNGGWTDKPIRTKNESKSVKRNKGEAEKQEEPSQAD